MISRHSGSQNYLKKRWKTWHSHGGKSSEFNVKHFISTTHFKCIMLKIYVNGANLNVVINLIICNMIFAVWLLIDVRINQRNMPWYCTKTLLFSFPNKSPIREFPDKQLRNKVKTLHFNVTSKILLLFNPNIIQKTKWIFYIFYCFVKSYHLVMDYGY